ncbi:hypothetical protein B0H13DRAFT_1880654 [Mycena leptocephala]|nr:hypothetical protein B0H13DRAFT_1880654 [Mycena leptocephala]
MAKGKFNDLQKAHLNTYLPEYIKKLDDGTSRNKLTAWKQATARKALASPAFADLDYTKYSRTKWFEMIVRKYTNYVHQVYRKTHPENISMSSATRANPLLKFSSILSGRQLFARDKQADVAAAAKQLDSDKGAQATNEVASYQTALKQLWDGLSPEEQAEWDEKAEDECGDIDKNQKEFAENIHQALEAYAKAVLIDSIHGHSKHNKTNFGGEDLGQNYGAPWSKFAEDASSSITVNCDGTVTLPPIDLDTISSASLRHLLQEYFQKCWIHRILEEGGLEQVPVPWAEITADPSKFYDTEKFNSPKCYCRWDLQKGQNGEDPEEPEFEDDLIAANPAGDPLTPGFNPDSDPTSGSGCGVHIPSSQSESGVHSTHLSGNTGGPASPATTVVRFLSPEIHIPNQLDDIPPPQKSPSPHTSPVPSTPLPLPPSQPRKAPHKSANKRVRADEPGPGNDTGKNKRRKVGNGEPTRVNAPRRSSRSAIPSQQAGISTLEKRGGTTKKSGWKGWVMVSESGSDDEE